MLFVGAINWKGFGKDKDGEGHGRAGHAQASRQGAVNEGHNGHDVHVQEGAPRRAPIIRVLGIERAVR